MRYLKRIIEIITGAVPEFGGERSMECITRAQALPHSFGLTIRLAIQFTERLPGILMVNPCYGKSETEIHKNNTGVTFVTEVYISNN